MKYIICHVFASKFKGILSAGILLYFISLASMVSAQIAPDNTLGSESSFSEEDVVKNLPVTIIKGGAIRGKNLFHSFLVFSVENDKGIYFLDQNGIENIVARVTGKNLSKIDGTLGVLGNSNLFLINPNGIFLGKNARLDLNGSLFISTANSVSFDNNFEFSASNPSSPPLLTINTPIGLRFGATAGSIINRSSVTDDFDNPIGLQVPLGKTLSLIGGDVSFDRGLIISPGSAVNIGSVGANNFISFNPSSTRWNLGYEYVREFQDIQLSLGSGISSSGLTSGNVQLHGRKINIYGGGVAATNEGDELGGNISVFATESLTIDGTGLPPGSFGGLVTGTLFGTKGSAGNISIVTKQMTIKGGSASIRTSSDGSGKGGNIVINSTDLIEILGGEINAETNGSGDAGNLEVSTPKLIIRDGGTILTSSNIFSTGDGGNIRINSSNFVEVENSGIGTFSASSGNAGNLLINANKLIVQNDGIVTVNSAGGSAGNLEVNARSIFLQDNSFLTAETIGGEGNIVLNTNDLLFLRGHSKISTNATGLARGGNITINTGVLAALENSDITANSEESFGGRVSISARGIFGTQFRENLTPESDITAKSALGSDFSGAVVLNITAVDPNQGLIELPTTVVDPSTLVAQNPCRQASSSEFTRSGRGGLPPSLSQDLNGESTQVGLVEPANLSAAKPEPQPASTQVSSLPLSSSQIAPAKGWIYNDKGEVVLVAYNSAVTGPQRLQSNPKGCTVL
jgi:filamentous hemagglutinin family protein